MSDPVYLTTREVAAMVKVSVDTLESWRAKGYGPKWYRLPGGSRLPRRQDARERRRDVPRYLASDVAAWIASCAVDNIGNEP